MQTWPRLWAATATTQAAWGCCGTARSHRIGTTLSTAEPSKGICASLQVRPTADGNSVDVEYDASNAKLDVWADAHGSPPIIVATGFIAKDPKVCASFE